MRLGFTPRQKESVPKARGSVQVEAQDSARVPEVAQVEEPAPALGALARVALVQVQAVRVLPLVQAHLVLVQTLVPEVWAGPQEPVRQVEVVGPVLDLREVQADFPALFQVFGVHESAEDLLLVEQAWAAEMAKEWEMGKGTPYNSIYNIS